MMNQQQSVSSISVERREHVVCPKPRRFGTVHDLPVRSLRWHINHQSELCDSRGADLLDAILTKGGGNGFEAYSYSNNNNNNNTQVASSPPFFSGSPPSRVANPLIQDARFGDAPPHSPAPMPSPPSSSSSARKGGGCVVRSSFGNKPAVRVEGFDCLDRDRRNCSIPAIA